MLLTDSLSTFGLNELFLGSMILIINLATMGLSVFWCWVRWRREHAMKKHRYALSVIELAVVNGIMGPRGGFDATSSGVEMKHLDGSTDEEATVATLRQHLLQAKHLKLQSRIGVGAFGTVFKGQHFGQPVAVKMLNKVTEANVLAFRSEVINDHGDRGPKTKRPAFFVVPF
jgi:hypothetical protein